MKREEYPAERPGERGMSIIDMEQTALLLSVDDDGEVTLMVRCDEQYAIEVLRNIADDIEENGFQQ